MAAVVKPVPCSAAEAIQRAVLLVGSKESYVLGTGNYRPGATDLPWTTNARGYGSDCWGYAGAWAYKLPRHRPGFNKGPWASVTDDINTDSAIEQAEHLSATDRLFEVVIRPMLGDLLVYPSIRGPDGQRLRIGHVGIVTKLCAEWNPDVPQYGEIGVVQCQASRKPAVTRGLGVGWLLRDRFRGMRNEAWRTRILRVAQP